MRSIVHTRSTELVMVSMGNLNCGLSDSGRRTELDGCRNIKYNILMTIIVKYVLETNYYIIIIVLHAQRKNKETRTSDIRLVFSILLYLRRRRRPSSSIKT